MKFLEIKNSILEELYPLAKENGYKINKKNFSLIKEEGNVKSSIYFTKNQWSDEIQLMPAVEVSINEIDSIIRKFNEYHNRTFWINLLKLKDWYDIGEVDWEKFTLNEGDRFKIIESNKDLEIEKIIDNLKCLIENYAFMYIKDYASIEGVDKLFNKNPKQENNVHCSGFHIQSIVGLTAAKLNCNLNYDEISEVYTRRMEEYKSENSIDFEDYERFFSIKNFLEDHEFFV